ncbi:cell division protein FtsL [Alteribacillus sp. YIM 98480]|uniref:cell division protein FtsL n=1 Tax=Alteribacillus sp. YIM 98480 TaxID=2606599 RepID=UPI00131B9EBA|nr:cell division protein FtsL [Alteribacillus sp. YIM 98480]
MDNLARQLQRQKQEKQVVQQQVQQHSIQRKVTKGEKLIITGMLMAVILASLLVVTNYANIYAQEREISSLNHSINQQSDINKSLELEVSELSAPDRIMHYAKEELGMELNDDKVKVIQNSRP